MKAHQGSEPWFWLAEQLEAERDGHVLIRWLVSTSGSEEGPYHFESFEGEPYYSQYVEAASLLDVHITLDKQGTVDDESLAQLTLLWASDDQQQEIDSQLSPAAFSITERDSHPAAP